MSNATEPQQLVDIAIQQLNLGYHQDQDRLLLRVGLSNGSELLVWITMRIAKQMWQLLNGESQLPNNKPIKVDHVPSQAVEQFKQEVSAAQTLQHLDFETAYQPREQMVNQGAVLAVSVNKDSNQLEITTLEGVNVRINLNQDLTLAICNMLQLAAKEAAWDIGSTAVASTVLMMDNESKQVLH